MNFAECDFQVAEKLGPAPCRRVLPPDQHVVVAVFRCEGKDFGGSRAQPAFGTVTQHSATNLARHREADARRIFIISEIGLKHDTALGAFASAGCGKKIAALAQSFELAVHLAARKGTKRRARWEMSLDDMGP